jgi:hypothetical protein
MNRWLWFTIGCIISATVSGAIGAVTNQPGFVAAPGTTFTAGNCLQVGSPVNGNTYVLTPVPCPTAPAIAIGAPIQGAQPNACLIADASSKMAQTDCLTAF